MLRFCLVSALFGLLLLAGPAQAISVGEKAPYFEAPSLKQGVPPTRLSGYRGKVVYVEFWASWCPPCWDAFPHLEKLYTEMADEGFEVLAVNVNDEKPDALKAMQKLDPSFMVVRPADDLVMQLYGINELPYGVLLDRDGVVRATFRGMGRSERRELHKMVKRLTWKGL